MRLLVGGGGPAFFTGLVELDRVEGAISDEANIPQ